jgi:hypothetical protein
LDGEVAAHKGVEPADVFVEHRVAAGAEPAELSDRSGH